ncbi:MAG: AAA family ATPase, partial [Nanoarchaeota archaeon]|nr:AAA family ATPase [Nanoarchaeota archaeon]
MTELIERMLNQNPWWEGKPIESIKGMEKRELFGEILGYLDAKQMLAVIGLRRVGKTVLLFQIIEHLIQKGANPRQILYFSFDELLAKEPDIIENILSGYENEILKQELKNIFIFFDEINHVRDWQ